MAATYSNSRQSHALSTSVSFPVPAFGLSSFGAVLEACWLTRAPQETEFDGDFSAFAGPSLSFPASRKTGSGSSSPPSTTSSRTTSKCSATRTPPTGTAGSCGACTSAPRKTGGTPATPLSPSGLWQVSSGGAGKDLPDSETPGPRGSLSHGAGLGEAGKGWRGGVQAAPRGVMVP